MKLTFNTLVVDLSVALKAIKLYQSGEFKQSISAIQDVLDLEPNNWDARLMLAVCYYKTGQYAAALRAFQLIADKTDCIEIRRKANEGVHVTAAKLDNRHNRPAFPAEFGCHVELHGMSKEPQLTWM